MMNKKAADSPPRRFFSLKWRALLVLSLLLLVINGLTSLSFYRNLLQQFEEERQTVHAKQTKELEVLTRQAPERLSALADLIPSLDGMSDSLASGKTRAITQTFAQHWDALQVNAAIDIAQLYARSGQLLQGWKAETLREPDLSLIQTYVDQVNQTERPQIFLDCIHGCVQYAVSPLLVKGTSTGVVVLGSTLAGLIVSFKEVSGSDIGILDIAKDDQGQTAPGERRIYNWGVRVSALTGLEANLPLLQSLAVQTPSLDQISAGIRIGFDGRSYEIKLIKTQQFAIQGGAYLVLIDDISQATAQIRQAIRQSVIFSTIGLLLSELALLAILWAPLSRLRTTVAALPLLAQNAFEQVRRIVGTRRRRGRFLDEFDVLGETIVSVSHQLERLQTAVEQRKGELTEANDLLEKELIERNRAERALHDSEETFRVMSAAAQDAIIMMDHAGKIAYWNAEAENIFGYAPQEVLGQEGHFLLAPSRYHQAYQAGYAEFERSGQGPVIGKILELEAVRKDGTEFPIELSVSATRLKGQWVAIGILRDITERKRAEEQIHKLNEELEAKVQERTRQLLEAQDELVRKEKLAVLGQVAGSVGHELRNPLGVMSNAVYFLKMVLTDADAIVKEYLDIIGNEITGSERIVSDLLDSVRTKPPRPQRVQVRDLIAESLEKCTIPERIQVRLDIPDGLPPIQVDPMQMQQVLRNLISNGMEAIAETGTLEILADREGEADQVRIRVKDSGIGIEAEQLKKLFQPLFTTKARGIGLGLVVVKNLTEANGGRVEVESEPGKGTAFAIILPIAQ
ncbi:MAG: PAS domain S-box protein [Methylococcaceae bacterium]|nr:PAS domain S-box protein [Methylococcaceae bacterium]